MRPRVTLRAALADKNLLGRALPGDSWRVWRILLIAACGEPLLDDEREVFRKISGRDHEPGRFVSELVACVGRRGGKSKAMACLAAYVAGLCDHSDVLVAGEVGVLLCVALNVKIAGVVMDYIAAHFEESPVLRQLIVNKTRDSLELSNGISVEVRAASFRKLRGPTYVCVICDELAFWFQDTTYANPDTEILAAVRPGLLTTRGPLILASSVYGKSGELYSAFKKHFGPSGAPAVLVAYGTSRDFHETLPQGEIDQALAADPARNAAEYLSQWRTDVETFVSRELVEACCADYVELAPASGRTYWAFCDPAGGSGSDSFALAISYKDGQQIVVAAVREIKPPFMATEAVERLAALLRMYGVARLQGDKWSGGVMPDLFARAGVRYEQSVLIKSDIYASILPLINSGRVTLPRNDRLVHQFASLERTTAFGSGRERIDHPRDMHDDLCNAVAGSIAVAAGVGGLGYNGYDIMHTYVRGSGDEDSEEQRNQLYRMRFLGHLRDCGYPVFGGW
jgi:hypothetical protein